MSRIASEYKVKVWRDLEYRKVIKELRKYFRGYRGQDGYDLRRKPLPKYLSPYQKRKIKAQFKYINHIFSGAPKRIYRARSRKSIVLIMEAQGYRNIPRNLKYAFIPAISEDQTKVRYLSPRSIEATDTQTGKTVTLVQMAPIETVTGDVRRRYINIDTDYLLNDTVQAVSDAMDLGKADFYTIQAGGDHEIHKDEYKIKKDDSVQDVARKINKLQNEYNNEDANNYHGNWLGGVIAYYFPDQIDYDNYHVERERRRYENKLQRDKLYKQIKRYRKSRAVIEDDIGIYKALLKRVKGHKRYSPSVKRAAIKRVSKRLKGLNDRLDKVNKKIEQTELIHRNLKDN